MENTKKVVVKVMEACNVGPTAWQYSSGSLGAGTQWRRQVRGPRLPVASGQSGGDGVKGGAERSVQLGGHQPVHTRGEEGLSQRAAMGGHRGEWPGKCGGQLLAR